MGPEIVTVKVTPERDLLFKGRNTNDEFVPYHTLISQSKQDGTAAEITARRMTCLHCLPTMQDVAWYITDEFKRFGAVCLRTEWN